jgi:hypothetical protein
VEREALEQLPTLPDDDDLVPSSVVKRELGGICDMTLWRWTYEPGSEVPFPLPDFVLNNRKYWKRRTLRQYRQRIELESRTQR